MSKLLFWLDLGPMKQLWIKLKAHHNPSHRLSPVMIEQCKLEKDNKSASKKSQALIPH